VPSGTHHAPRAAAAACAQPRSAATAGPNRVKIEGLARNSMAPGTVPSRLRCADDQRCVLARAHHSVKLGSQWWRLPARGCLFQTTSRGRHAASRLRLTVTARRERLHRAPGNAPAHSMTGKAALCRPGQGRTGSSARAPTARSSAGGPASTCCAPRSCPTRCPARTGAAAFSQLPSRRCHNRCVYITTANIAIRP